jgi:hypothetical protein
LISQDFLIFEGGKEGSQGTRKQDQTETTKQNKTVLFVSHFQLVGKSPLITKQRHLKDDNENDEFQPNKGFFLLPK